MDVDVTNDLYNTKIASDMETDFWNVKKCNEITHDILYFAHAYFNKIFWTSFVHTNIKMFTLFLCIIIIYYSPENPCIS